MKGSRKSATHLVVGIILVLVFSAGVSSSATVRAERTLDTYPTFAQTSTTPFSIQGTCPPANCLPGKNVGRDYFVQVVQRLNNVPFNDFAVDALVAWEPYINTNACWNPLATTWRMEVICNFGTAAAQGPPDQDAGIQATARVQSYQNQDMGVRATANTLNLSYYNAIRKMLRLEAFDREGLRGSLRTWGVCSGSGCNSLLDTWQILWSSRGGVPAGYTFCAQENQRCAFSGTKNVAYGANGQFKYKYGVTGGINCNNSTFGDPAPNVVKACYAKDVTGPAGYTFCTSENQRCSFSGTKDVAYGSDGKFNYKYGVTGGIDCNNKTFGDPIPYVIKACHIKDSGTTGYNRLVAKHSGRCMDVYGASTANGVSIIQWDCHGGYNQAWSLAPMGNNYYKLVARHSGRCLDVYGASSDNGARLIQWDCHGGDNQLFKLEQIGSYYRLRAKHSNRCVDVYGASSDNGVRLIQWDCHGGNNQSWSIQLLAMSAMDGANGPVLEATLNESILPPAVPYTITLISHTVHEGDSPELMADVYETTVEAILEANPDLFDRPEEIQPGMTLFVPVDVPVYQPFTNLVYLPVVLR